jgi:hypothetical protein
MDTLASNTVLSCFSCLVIERAPLFRTGRFVRLGHLAQHFARSHNASSRCVAG